MKACADCRNYQPLDSDVGECRASLPIAVDLHADDPEKYFTYEHLPEKLQAISAPFSKLARSLANDLEGPELTVESHGIRIGGA